jgi:hypothetical protein
VPEGLHISDLLSKLDTILLESTDEIMKKVFGDTVPREVLAYLSDGFSTGDFPSHIQQVRSGLSKLFGRGAQPLEALLLERLSNGLDTDHSPGMSFMDYAVTQG